MSPARSVIVTDHPRELRGHLHLQAGGHRGDVHRDVVGVVQHGGEPAHLGRDRLFGEHVTLVAAAEHRHVALELRQETEELLRQGGDGVLVALPALVRLADGESVLGMVVPPPEDMVSQRLHHQTLEQGRVLRPRP